VSGQNGFGVDAAVVGMEIVITSVEAGGSSHGRHCHSTQSSTAIDCHSSGIYTLILLSLRSFSVKMTVSSMARWRRRGGRPARRGRGPGDPGHRRRPGRRVGRRGRRGNSSASAAVTPRIRFLRQRSWPRGGGVACHVLRAARAVHVQRSAPRGGPALTRRSTSPSSPRPSFPRAGAARGGPRGAPRRGQGQGQGRSAA
jgi:hypothetical protein